MADYNERELFGAWISPYMSMVAHLLFEAGIEFRYRRVSPFSGQNRSTEHYAVNALGKVPSFRDANGVTLSESLAICRYVARTYEAAYPFYPCRDPERCAEVDALSDFLTFSVGGPFFNWFVVGKHFPVAWRLKTEEESRTFSLWSMMLVNGELQRLVQAAHLDPYLLGSDPTMVDIQLFYTLEHGRTFAMMLDEPSFDLRLGNPALMSFYEVIEARPASQRVLQYRADEFERNRLEYFEQMETGFREMIAGVRPLLASMFGHDV